MLAALAWWLWQMQRNRGEESRFFKASLYERDPTPAVPLRTVAYPSDAQTRELRRFREQWIEEFRSLQLAWSRHDLRPVYGIIGPGIRRELEAEVRRLAAEPSASLFDLKLNLAEPADSWREDGREYVTVHFAGELRDSRKPSRNFDEFWTFSRDWSEPEFPNSADSALQPDSSWVVTTIRRGNRERSLPRLA